jgi:hypothetical protein
MNQETIQEETPIEDLNEEEITALAEALTDDPRLSSAAAPTAKEKQDIMNFFNNVLSTDDTTKVSNLSDEELAQVRYYQRAALYALEVDYTLVGKYIRKRAEIVLSTALSGKTRGGFFLQLINTAKKMIESRSSKGTFTQKDAGGNKGWFKKRH